MTPEEMKMHMHVFRNAFIGVFRNGNREMAVKEYVKQLAEMAKEQGLDFMELVREATQEYPAEE